jgi:quinol monooxygenase YgiN
MSVSVVIAFAGAVLAAIGTWVLAGRCFRTSRIDLIAWAGAMAGLAIALGGQALGSQSGYGSATFRTVQIGAQLIAPLWLAWGLVELTAKGVAVRFGAKLVTAALTFVAFVVLVTDPLSATAFSKSWPAASAHYQIIPKSLLGLVAAVTVLTVVIALAVTGARARNDPGWRRPMVAAAAAGAAAVVILGLRLILSVNSGYAALCVVSAALAWFAGLRAAKVDVAELHDDEVTVRAAGRRARGSRDRRRGLAEPEPSGDGHRGYAENDDEPFGDESWYRPAASQQQNGGYRRSSEYEGSGYQLNGADRPEMGYRPDRGDEMNGLTDEDFGYDPEERVRPARGYQQDDGMPDRPDADRAGIWRPRGLGRGAALAAGPAPAGLAPAAPGPAGPAPAAGREPAGTAQSVSGSAGREPAGPRPAAPASGDHEAAQQTYGMIAIYTLADDRAAEFDALAERVVDEVRDSEPDTLVYAVHTVPNAPLQRIFYQVYRDKMAYEDHCRQTHIQLFEAERGPYVLATNVIELGMRQAKLSSVPGLSQLFGPAPGQ